MDDLAQWLSAQLDEDAEANTSPYAEGAWHTRGCASVPDVFGQETSECDCGVPARVLREIDAKRKLLARYDRAMENRRAHPDDLASAGALLALHGAVKLLALPYADRPGYREEWSP